jgi:hypothetical protein
VTGEGFDDCVLKRMELVPDLKREFNRGGMAFLLRRAHRRANGTVGAFFEVLDDCLADFPFIGCAHVPLHG